MAKKNKSSKGKGLLAGAPPEGWGVPVTDTQTPGTPAQPAPAADPNVQSNWEYGKRGSRTWTNKVTGETITGKGMKSNPGTKAPEGGAGGTVGTQQYYDVRTPTGQAGAQFQGNVQAAGTEAAFNRPQEVTPYGNLTYTMDPATGQLIRKQELSPWEQAKLQNQAWYDLELQKLGGAKDAGGLGIFDRAREAMAQPFNYQGLPQAPTALNPQDTMGQYQKTQDQLYDYYKRRLDPMFAQEKQDFEQGLANRGIPEGSEQYQRLIADFDRRKSDSYQDAISRATEGAGAEQTRLSQIGQTYFDQSQAARNSGIQERIAQRQYPLQELGSILGGVSGVNQPNFVPFSGVNVGPPPIFDAATGELNRQNQLANTQIGASAQLGAAEIAANAGIEEANIRNQGALDLAQYQASQNPKPKNPSFWGQLGNALLPGFAAGVGSGFGSWLGGK